MLHRDDSGADFKQSMLRLETGSHGGPLPISTVLAGAAISSRDAVAVWLCCEVAGSVNPPGSCKGGSKLCQSQLFTALPSKLSGLKQLPMSRSYCLERAWAHAGVCFLLTRKPL